MYVTTQNPIGEFTSPFGSRFEIPSGQVTRVAVEHGYWLLRQPDVEITWEDSDEQDEGNRLIELSKFNPMKGVPKPQHLSPNATLQLDGFSTRYPVIVVNPIGLMSEYQGEYNFQQPQVNLIIDKEMIRQVLKEIQSAINEEPEVSGNELDALEPAPKDPSDVSDVELDALTKPDEVKPDEVTPAETTTGITPDPGTPPELPAEIETTPPADGEPAASDEAPEETAGETGTEESADDSPDGEEVPASEPKGKSRGRRGAISDEEI